MLNPDPDKFTASDINAHKLHVTFFNDAFAKTKESRELTLPELRDRILAKSGPTKAALPWLKLATLEACDTMPTLSQSMGWNWTTTARPSVLKRRLKLPSG
jgi:hypothetical protein